MRPEIRAAGVSRRNFFTKQGLSVDLEEHRRYGRFDVGTASSNTEAAQVQPKLPSAQVAWLPMAHNVPAVANTFSSVVVRCEEWGTPVELGKTELLHYGYSLEVVRGRNKMARNLRLLLRAIEEMPNEPNLIMNLGLELVRAGHLARGLEQYYEGFARCRSCRRKMFRRNCARRCSRKWRRG